MPVFRRVALLVALTLTLTVAALAWPAAPASAHNALESTDPADGSTVGTLPDAVVLTFNLPALSLGSAITVTGPAGDVAEGKPQFVNDTVSQPVRAGAPAGAYTVVWRVTSADGHPISGTFRFTATSGGDGGTAPSATPSSAVAAAPAAAPAATDTGGSPSPWLWAGIGVLVVIVVVGTAVAARRTAR